MILKDSEEKACEILQGIFRIIYLKGINIQF